MAAEWLLTTQFLAAGAMGLLAVWLLWLDFNSRVVRAFAVFLVVRGAHIAANQMAILVEDPEWRALWEHVRWFYALAVVPALLSFLVVYVWPRRTTATTITRTCILGAAVGVELLYIADPCRAYCTSSGDVIAFGPLSIVVVVIALVSGLAALWLAREARSNGLGPRREAAYLLSWGLALNALLEAGLAAVFLAGNGWSLSFEGTTRTPWLAASFAANILAAMPAVLAVFYLHAGATARMRARVPFLWGSLGALALTVGLVEWGPELLGTPDLLGRFVIGAWRMALPLLATYAIVRYRLFGLEVKLNGTFGHGTVAAAFLSVFFITSEMAQQFFSGKVGPFLGIVAAGFLVFAIAPLEHFGRNLAHKIMGTPDAGGQLSSDERLSLFREQAAIAWQDGALTRRERLLLEQLRERLGISPEQATRIEGEAVRMDPNHPDVGPGGTSQTKGLS